MKGEHVDFFFYFIFPGACFLKSILKGQVLEDCTDL